MPHLCLRKPETATHTNPQTPAAQRELPETVRVLWFLASPRETQRPNSYSRTVSSEIKTLPPTRQLRVRNGDASKIKPEEEPMLSIIKKNDVLKIKHNAKNPGGRNY